MQRHVKPSRSLHPPLLPAPLPCEGPRARGQVQCQVARAQVERAAVRCTFRTPRERAALLVAVCPLRRARRDPIASAAPPHRNASCRGYALQIGSAWPGSHRRGCSGARQGGELKSLRGHHRFLWWRKRWPLAAARQPTPSSEPCGCCGGAWRPQQRKGLFFSA